MFRLLTLESLSKINLYDDERIMAEDFFTFFTGKFDALSDLDTENIEPLVTVSTLENVMRDDISHKMVDRETLLANAPEENSGHFVVPRILE